MIEQDKFYETFKFEIDLFIKKSLEEDIGNGDYTTKSCLQSPEKRKMILKVNQPCILAGVELAKKIFSFYDSDIKIDINLTDGSSARIGEIGFIVSGKASSLLILERLVLNCMQRMSGIATKTKTIKNLITKFDVKILDTRKTTPSIRFLEKWAVKIGGGENHRLGLFDMIMIKDNHIDFNKDLKTTINKAIQFKKQNNLNVKIIVEVRTINDIIEILNLSGFDRIVLDNFNIEDTNEAVKLINKKYPIESSGGINEHNILSYAKCGVNYISIGDLTHSIQNFDLSLTATK